MAFSFSSSTFKPRSFTLCNSPSTLSSNFNTFSHGFLILSPHKPHNISSHMEAKASISEQHSKSTISRRIIDKIERGFSSLESKDQRVEKKPVEIDKKVVKEQKDKNSRNRFDSKKKRYNGSGSSSSLNSKHENITKNMSKYVKMDKGDESDDPGMKKRVKRSKKGKFESPVAVLRVGLEICSKRGDVMGAIGIYDLAKREGIKLGQYHYGVILYLCSSAAVGVVQPAKSGRSDTTSSKIELSNNNSVNLEEPTKIHVGLETVFQTLDGLIRLINEHKDSNYRNGIRVCGDVKEYALKRGFEIYEEMVSDEIPMSEAILTSLARMAMSRDNGQMAFDMVKQMKDLGINPRLRSYGPALSVFCRTGNLEKAFEVEEHMLSHGVFPEEPELEALLRVSIEAGRNDKVYYLLHKLRTSVRKVLPSTADVIENWFKSKTASRIGRRKWDKDLINKSVENGGGGWHGQGWLGKGKWSVTRSFVGKDGLCQCCGEKLATIDLDPIETERFAESVARIAKERDRNSSFEKFQKWLDYYGPFEAVVDGANVGLFSQRRFKPSKVNTIANGIRQMLPTKKWPLVILHNRRVTGDKMDEGMNKSLVEKWKTADALYATPTGSNDDWYWLYAAIKFKCLLVTNDEMRDHLFQLLGNDFFPKWKERHQVRFNFSETGPVYHMPPPCSVVIQESRKGHWHIPIASEQDSEEERVWLCVTRDTSSKARQECISVAEELGGKGLTESDSGTEAQSKDGSHGSCKQTPQEIYGNLKEALLPSLPVDQDTILTQITSAEKHGDCVIDFQI
ncbi:hypothetical protein L6452_21594 [Arctium lappa]|uniref:Uncharacterized protein n=1 Tax=Arctium lappa TaxID=4217 RepID=A0ACB9AXH9_ARCLA|nr:hypothetical protein L6452_21594 [Arctium lappa]